LPSEAYSLVIVALIFDFGFGLSPFFSILAIGYWLESDRVLSEEEDDDESDDDDDDDGVEDTINIC
jgi:hypothetical protein